MSGVEVTGDVSVCDVWSDKNVPQHVVQEYVVLGMTYISVFRKSHTTDVVFIVFPGPLAGRLGPLTLELERLGHRDT